MSTCLIGKLRRSWSFGRPLAFGISAQDRYRENIREGSRDYEKRARGYLLTDDAIQKTTSLGLVPQ
jgi:hypothetical protein